MGWAVFRVMALRILRDPGALLLTFVLPSVIYVIFAAIFANASAGELDLRVGVADLAQTDGSRAFIEQLDAAATLTLLHERQWGEDEIAERVRLGTVDVGLVVVSPPETSGPAAFRVIEEPSRRVAASALSGQIASQLSGGDGQALTVVSTAGAGEDDRPRDQSVTYYIGAVGMMFLLFSSLQAAAITLEERNSGISERLLVGLKGAVRIFRGKFVFLTLVAFVQVAIICAVAQLMFDVPVLDHIGGTLLACLSVSMFAAGFALFVASLCASAAQLHAVSTFLVLVLSAVGGSMVPRFMMPGWLQGLSRATPNGWAIDAFYGILARGQTVAELWWVWCILLGGGAMLSVVAAMMSQRLGRV